MKFKEYQLVSTSVSFPRLLLDPPIFRSEESFLSADLTDAREHCAQCGMQLCSLAQLKAAYDAGYRNDQWGLIDTIGQLAKVVSCGDSIADKCFFVGEGSDGASGIPFKNYSDGLIPSYCCPFCDVYKRK